MADEADEASGDDLLDRLRDELGGMVDDAEEEAFSGFLSAILGRLDDSDESGSEGAISFGAEKVEQPPLALSARYDDVDLIARGGMGEVRRVRDHFLRRTVAVKRMLAQDGGGDGLGSLYRFVEEAQITGQLEHPGVVPVYDLAMERDGSPVFTMRMIRGETFADGLKRLREGSGGWTVARALDVLAKVCDAVAYAHSKSVVHRDLKPANILVGAFGEVYVTDWGLAKVLGRSDARDLRVPSTDSVDQIDTERFERARSGDTSGVLTMDGTIVGTPSYMPPEQAGAVEGDLDRRADVYAIGAMLYEVLAGVAPYNTAGHGVRGIEVLASLRKGPPKSLQLLAPKAAPELTAICERAMQRQPSERYGDVGELRADLLAFLEGKVVQAYRTGPLVELSKWIRRNRALATTIAVAAVAAFTAIGGIGLVQRNARIEIERLADVKRLEQLDSELEQLVPAHPSRLEGLRAWRTRALALEDRLALHRATRARVAERDADDPKVRWQLGMLDDLIAGIERLVGPDGDLARVERRIDLATEIERATLIDVADRWERAIATVSDPERCPAYAGLRIAPQLGLVPIGLHPDTELYEFAVWGTGAIPELPGTAPLEDDAVRLVLLPGADYLMGGSRPIEPGTQREWVAPENVDVLPEHPVDLEPFFIATHETSQAQWERMTTERPSHFRIEVFADAVEGELHPVESVSWNEAHEYGRVFGLELPTEAQWEYAAAAGTRTPWYTGATQRSLEGHVNVADRDLARVRPFVYQGEVLLLLGWPLEDGFPFTAPIGSYAANPFGLHDIHGNVAEWCRDDYTAYDAEPARTGDGLRNAESETRVYRGGSWNRRPHDGRVHQRHFEVRGNRLTHLGVRYVRPLTP